MTENSEKPVDPNSLPYRPCVGQMVINWNGHVWIGRRAGPQNDSEGKGTWWQMPQGGIDPGEEPAAARRRELFQEIAMGSRNRIA